MTTGRMTLPRRVLGAVAILIACCGVCSAQAPSASSPPMTNGDVVKMAKVGFGSEVIEAKIAEARSVDFRLEVDDLAKLKAAGVSEGVIAAMLKRSSNSTGSGRADPPTALPTNYSPSAYSDAGRVKLLTSDQHSFELHAIGGSMSTTFAYVTTLMHANFPGGKSDIRIQDRRPTLLIKSPNSPKGHFYLVLAETDSKDDVRSVKMGNSRFFGVKNIGAPDSDNQMPYEVTPEGAGTWRLTPTKDLRPGEYGLWGSMTEMYDFGIDP